MTYEVTSLIYLAAGLNGLPNVYCWHHGWIDSGETYGDRKRPWIFVLAAVNEHLARYHSDVPQEVP